MKIQTTNDVWFTSDTHYMHTNMCKGVTRWDISTPEKIDAVRDFKTLEEMNEAIVTNINKIIKEDDWLIHGGDWSFGGYDMIKEFRSKINCKNILLILGNHDHHILRNKENVRDIFSHVSEKEHLEIGDVKMILNHYPPKEYWEGKENGVYYINGHTHNKREKRFKEGRTMDIGICGSPEFRPYHFDEIVDLLKDKPF